MTEDDPGVEVKSSGTTASPVNRDSGTRRASRLAVKFDVGELGVLQWSCVRSREAILRVYYKLATRMLWLACGVHFDESPKSDLRRQASPPAVGPLVATPQ